VVAGLENALVGRLLLASFLGGIIGLEREIHGRPAGFRTHLLVSLGSCLFVLTSIAFYDQYGNFSGTLPVGVDPGRVAAQVVTGIGFLGAGAIIREKTSIRGLTTAACLWVAAALGVACGIGLYYLAMWVTVVALSSLLLLKEVERRLSRDVYLSVKVWGEDGEGFLASINQIMASCGSHPKDIRFEKDLERGWLFVEFQAKCSRKFGPAEILATVSQVAGVKRVRVD